MKTIKLISVIICMVSTTLTTLGQEKLNINNIVYKTGNPVDWPAEMDAVIAVPENHKILLENDNVSFGSNTYPWQNRAITSSSMA